MLTVYKFGGAWGLPDISPFCIKLETYLRIAGIPYQTKIGDPRGAPRRKLPWIDEDGRRIADSARIIEHLERTRDAPVDGHLSAAQRALATAVRSMLEEHHYFVMLYARWWRDEDFAIYTPAMRRYCEDAGVPRLLRALVIGMARRNIKASLVAQGVARHSPDEIMAVGMEQWTAVAELLGDQRYVLGDRPSTVDATLYAFLAGTIWAPFDGPIKAHALAQPGLVAYAERIRGAYWA